MASLVIVLDICIVMIVAALWWYIDSRKRHNFPSSTTEKVIVFGSLGTAALMLIVGHFLYISKNL